jgi:DNA repair photolyase
MNTPGIPAPSFVGRIGAVVDSRRSVQFQELRSKTLLNRLTEGMPFGWTVNPFRGCEFGCRYCYARSTHEYLGHCEPQDFETRIYVKRVEPSRLMADLMKARDSGQEVAVGTATDPYQPAEARFEITRRVLETMLRVPGLRIGITTKSASITRDVALLRDLQSRCELSVNFSLISMDASLLRVIEPRAPRPDLRLAAMRTLTDAGVSTRVFIMPVLPLIADSEAGLRAVLTAARRAGAGEAICNALFLRTPMTWRFFLAFVAREFPWALARYRALYPRPGPAPREYREEVEIRVARLAREAGFRSRSREDRVKDEAPARPRQLSLVW